MNHLEVKVVCTNRLDTKFLNLCVEVRDMTLLNIKVVNTA